MGAAVVEEQILFVFLDGAFNGCILLVAQGLRFLERFGIDNQDHIVFDRLLG